MEKTEKQDKVVVRFAPSPTGYLHIGGARTAIFNWLYALKHNGKFILRIEDTDARRSTRESIEGIVSGLKWLGLSWDEGPNFQSRNIEAHIEAAQALIQSGHAYRCFCTKETIEQKRQQAKAGKKTYRYDGACRDLTPDQVKENLSRGMPFAIRLKVPDEDGGVSFEDAVYGRIEKKYKDLEDFIIVRSNGKPLYVLSNTVDDIRDQVSHIIRGQDGLANTPKQILIYRALKAEVPVFAHMSLTLDPNKAKISKRRHGELVAIHYYRENGFLPWAMVNFLVLLGWATKESKQFFSKEELVQAFSLSGISRTNSVFEIQPANTKFFTDPKAVSINAHYIRNMALTDLFPHLRQEFEKNDLWRPEYDSEKKEWVVSVIDLIRSRCSRLTQFATMAEPYFLDSLDFDPDILKEHVRTYPEMKEWFPALAEQIRSLTAYNEVSLEPLIKQFLKQAEIKPGKFISGMRVMLTGQPAGPDFIKSLVVMGRQKVSDRLARTPSVF